MDDNNKFNGNADDENLNEEIRRSESLTSEDTRTLIDNQERYKEPRRGYAYGSTNKKKGFRGSFFSYIAIALIAALIGGLAAPYLGNSLYGTILPNPKNDQYASSPVIINTSDDMTTVSAVAKKSMSSVVGITTIEEVQQGWWFMPQAVEGVGTGVIVDSNGYILTNSHVVRDGNAKSINVLLENGEKQEATLLWNDPALDLAMVKIDKTGLPVAELGDSDKLMVGEPAIAIGNPLGLEFQRSVTSGIISGLNRSIQVSQSNVIENLIQTDASINNGNSGGPLLNSHGQVIGINTAKVQSAEGLGFSIPINEAKLIIEQVIKNGSYETVFLGISGRTVQEYEAVMGVNLEVESGLVLAQISKGTPADKAGLLIGDIITKIDGVKIDNIMGLKKSLYKYKKGDKAILTIIRSNQEQQVEIHFTDLR